MQLILEINISIPELKCCWRASQAPLWGAPSAITNIMGDIDDFFAKKDKKKKGTKKFSKANTEVLAKNLEETAIKEQMQQEKEITNIGDDLKVENPSQQVWTCFTRLDQTTLWLPVLMMINNVLAYMDIKTVQTEL